MQSVLRYHQLLSWKFYSSSFIIIDVAYSLDQHLFSWLLAFVIQSVLRYHLLLSWKFYGRLQMLLCENGSDHLMSLHKE